MEPIIASSQLLHVAKVWEDISHRLYATFWSLSLYDLYVPTTRYEEEVNRAKQASHDVENSSDMVRIERERGGGGYGGVLYNEFLYAWTTSVN